MSRLLSLYNPFGLGYFILLILSIGIILGLIFALRKLNGKARNISQIAIISCIGIFVVLEYIIRAVMTSKFKFGDHMPIELFEILAYLSIFIFFSKKSSWKKFSYLIIVPISAYNLIFTPTMYTIFSDFSPCIIFYFLTNALILANGILNALWLEFDMEKRDILESSITGVIIIAIGHLFNVFMRFATLGVHANYFGTMGEEYDICIKWLYSIIPIPFVCVIPLIAILVGIEFLILLPFELLKSKKDRQSEIEELIALGNMKAQAEHREKTKKGKSQVLVRSEKKATPATPKNVKNSSNNSGFVTTTKEVQVNKDVKKE